MTKDELKAKAKEMGLKVRENFMDDAFENCIILAIGALLGAAGYKMFW
jgi:hypothetical protein